MSALRLVEMMLVYLANFPLFMICGMTFRTSQQPLCVGFHRTKGLRAVQIIVRNQEENGVLLKLHLTTDTFPVIGENVQIVLPVTLLKVPLLD